MGYSQEERREIIKGLDRLWRELQVLLWPRCAIKGCKVEGVEIHHLCGRGLAVRWEVLGGMGLCSAHHRGSDLSPHGTPDKFLSYLARTYPDHYKFYMENKWRVSPYFDYERAERILAEKLENCRKAETIKSLLVGGGR